MNFAISECKLQNLTGEEHMRKRRGSVPWWVWVLSFVSCQTPMILALPVQPSLEQGMSLLDVPQFLTTKTGADLLTSEHKLFDLPLTSLAWIPCGCFCSPDLHRHHRRKRPTRMDTHWIQTRVCHRRRPKIRRGTRTKTSRTCRCSCVGRSSESFSTRWLLHKRNDRCDELEQNSAGETCASAPSAGRFGNWAHSAFQFTRLHLGA